MSHYIVAIPTARVLDQVIKDIFAEKNFWAKGRNRDFVITMALAEILETEGRLISFTKSNQEEVYLCRVESKYPDWLAKTFTRFLDEAEKKGLCTIRLWDILQIKKGKLLKLDENVSVRVFLEDLKKDKVPEYKAKSQYELFKILREWFFVKEEDLKPYKIYK